MSHGVAARLLAFAVRRTVCVLRNDIRLWREAGGVAHVAGEVGSGIGGSHVGLCWTNEVAHTLFQRAVKIAIGSISTSSRRNGP